MEKDKKSIHKIGGKGLMSGENDLTKLVTEILSRNEGKQIIFVVSAFSGVTRLLGDIYNSLEEGHPTKEIELLVDNFKKIHKDRIDELGLGEDSFLKDEIFKLDLEFEKIRDLPVSLKNHAMMLSFGERYSSLVFSAFLKQLNKDCLLLDARTVIFGKGDNPINADLDINSTISFLGSFFSKNSDKIIVTQGYICSSLTGDTLVLGFDGSDLTAAIIALYFLIEKKYFVYLTYWKDVCGVNKMGNNENDFFKEMSIIEYSNFSIVNTVPVRGDSIRIFLEYSTFEMLSIFIRSFMDLDNEGTRLKERSLL